MMQDQTRRQFLTLAGSAALLPLTGLPGLAALPAETPLHGLSAFGELKYGPDFTHFAYANLAAPKGGTFNFSPPNWAFNQGAQTFDTLNSFTFRGNAPMRMELCFDALMTRALDEPDAEVDDAILSLRFGHVRKVLSDIETSKAAAAAKEAELDEAREALKRAFDSEQRLKDMKSSR